APLTVLEYHRCTRRPRQQAVEQSFQSTSTTAAPSTILADSPDHRARKLGRRIEASQHGLEMHAAHAAQRLHVERGKGTREPGVAAPQPAIYIARREPELAGDRGGIAGRIAQFVRGGADMIRLLSERQTQPVAVEQRAAPRFEHDALGAL